MTNKLAPQKLCSGCLACKDACKKNAINIIYDNGVMYPEVQIELCIDCHSCEKVCPIETPIELNKVNDMRVFGGWSNDPEIRMAAASGGAFSALAQCFFRLYTTKATVVGASLIEGTRVEHIMIKKEKELCHLRNSKYVQSVADGIYRKVRDELKADNYVLFSGTPCLIAGLYGFLGKNRNDEKLTTIDLVCHGINTQETLDIALKSANAEKMIVFRDKSNGHANGQSKMLKNGKELKNTWGNDPFFRLFSGGLMMRPSCYDCKYSRINRVADITLADFWGSSFSSDEHKKGVSLIIANNNKGLELIEASDKEMFKEESTLLNAIKSNANLYTGKNHLKYHPLIMMGEFSRKLLPSGLRLSILRNEKPWNLFWGVFRMITKIHERNQFKRIVKMYCK